jgi:hypothetical protein
MIQGRAGNLIAEINILEAKSSLRRPVLAVASGSSQNIRLPAGTQCRDWRFSAQTIIGVHKESQPTEQPRY